MITRVRLADANARLAAARRLTGSRGRRASGRFLAEGIQAVREAVRRPGTVVEVFGTAAALARHAPLLDGLTVSEISERAAGRLSETVSPQGLVAVCEAVDIPRADALARRPRLAAALVEVADPGNAGTMLRSADAAGAGAVAFVAGADPYGGKCVRASAGSLFHLDVVVDDDVTALAAAAADAGMCVLAATGSGRCSLDELGADTLARPTLWLFGNEARGLPDAALASAQYTVRVPIHGRAESLNVASAAAVCLYASAREQRR